jgi:hypothetical protein
VQQHEVASSDSKAVCRYWCVLLGSVGYLVGAGESLGCGADRDGAGVFAGGRFRRTWRMNSTMVGIT